jgi:tRNA 2-thiouridine synthesizing protein A
MTFSLQVGPPGRPQAPSGARRSPAGDAMHAPTPEPALTIDALGRKCPIPIIMLAERIAEIGVGEVLAVLSDDPAAQTDVPAWCQLKSHEFLAEREEQSGWAFLVRRSY